MKCVAQKRLCFKAPIPVSRQFSSGLLGKLRSQEGSDADTASSSGARFSHTGESEGLVMKHKGPWEGGWARIPIGKGKGKFAHPSRSWAPKFPLPLSASATKAKARKGMTKSPFIKGRYDAPVTRLAMFGS